MKGESMFKKKSNTYGASAKVPIYKKKWFWVIIVILIVAAVSGGGDTETDTTEKNLVVESISAVYDGSTEAGTLINDDSNFTVTAKYDDETSKKVDGWSIVEPTTLAAGQSVTVTVKYEDKTTDVVITCTTIDEATFKASCQSIPYDELARNGDNYKYTPITFRGEIIQVMEGNGFTSYRINVTKGSYDIWEDTMYVQYTLKEGQSRFLEDDIVTVYGTCMGLYSYETVLGSNVTIPSAVAEYMELS